MLYKQFKDDNISLLGFGCMRFPLIEGTSTVDEALTEKMVDYAIEHGVNYFDTAAPYHNGTSETVIGKILKKYPRDSFYLATKYPGHQIKPGTEDETTTPEAVFEAQLKKCQVEYFDYYLLHNVCENSYAVYTSEERKILDYFVEQKKQGRIRHLGFSSHGKIDNLKDFVERYGEHLEF
ncbi:MAG: aldo/keto reductase, partial [Clostridia bacterium]|nr:aldo/keto reductase [Clostridia bacterium]